LSGLLKTFKECTMGCWNSNSTIMGMTENENPELEG